MIGFSFRNEAQYATLAASTTFTEQDTTVGLRFPQYPHLRGYSPDLATHRVTYDFGIATDLDVIVPIHANFSAAGVQGHATDTWSAPTYAQAITLGRSGNDRYHHAYLPTHPFSFRYLSLRVPTGATTDGAVRWALGGIWAGLITWMPEVLPDPDEEKREFFKDVETDDGRVVERTALDDPAWAFTGLRAAEDEAELAAWKEIDRRWSAAPGQIALVIFRDGAYPEECYLMRKDSSKWRHGTFWMESELVLREVTAG